MFRRLARPVLWGFLGFLVATKLVEWLVESWWFEAEGFAPVFRVMFTTRAVAFGLGALIFEGVLEANARHAWRASQPPPIKLFPGEPVFDPSFRRRVRALRVLTGLIALGAGWLCASRWMLWQRFLHAPSNRDFLSFYLLQLPALNWAWSFLWTSLWLSLLLGATIYAAQGALQWEEKHLQISPRALSHLTFLGALLLTWKALGYALSVANLHLASRGDFCGAFSVDDSVRTPLAAVLAGVALGCAISLWRAGRNGRARSSLAPPLVYLGASWLLGMGVPAAVQRARVEPNELSLERPFLQRHLQATRRAYGLEDVASINDAPQPVSAARLETLLDGLPLWPPEALREVLNREQARHDTTLHFARVTLDAYPIGGEMRPVYVAAREKTGQALAAFNWTAQHEQNTHGDGLIICDGSRTTPQGGPLLYLDFDGRAQNGARFSQRQSALFFAQWQFVASPWGTTPLGALQKDAAQPKEALPASIFDPSRAAPPALKAPPDLKAPQAANAPLPVQAAQMGPPLPVLAPGAQSSRDEHGRYVVARPQDVAGRGVTMGGWWHKALLAWRFLDVRLMLSEQEPSRRTLWHRDVVERCHEIAPFLWWEDADPRPILTSQGRVVWLLDAYQISDNYPDAQPLPNLGANFLRHAAWATVDAQSGQTRFYASTLNAANPLSDSTQRIFPGLLRDAREMPPELQSHLRYPATLLTAQAQIWGRYHVATPDQLFARAGRWSPAAIPQPKPYDALRPILRPANLALNTRAQLATYQPLTPLEDRVGGLQVPAAAPLTALLIAEPAPVARRFVLRQWTPKIAPPASALGVRPTDEPAPDETAQIFSDRTDSLLSLSLLPQSQALISARGEWNPTDPSGLKRTFMVANPRAQTSANSARLAAQGFARENAPPVSAPPVAASIVAQSPARTLQQARAQWQQMQRARKGGDWAAYGQSEHTLNQLLQP